MEKDKFIELLKSRGFPQDKHEAFFEIAQDFEDYIQGRGNLASPSAEDVFSYSEWLITEGKNQYETYVAIAQYARYRKKDELLVAIIELVDGSEVLDNFYAILGEQLGEEVRDAVFAEVELPPLGTPSAKKPAITQKVMSRFEELVDAEVGDRILSACLRSLPDDFHSEARQQYLDSDNLQAFLQAKGDALIAELEELRDSGALYFTQPITDEVIDYVNCMPEIRQGLLDGDVIYEAKIPYMTVEYLKETDKQKKRYYYCHCPWVRESIPAGDVQVSPNFCKCSAGFHAKFWEAAFGQPLKVDVVESVLQGDEWCKFVIHLPQEAKVL
jgi:hypothetical protein